jgi:hypothetical protein
MNNSMRGNYYSTHIQDNNTLELYYSPYHEDQVRVTSHCASLTCIKILEPDMIGMTRQIAKVRVCPYTLKKENNWQRPTRKQHTTHGLAEIRMKIVRPRPCPIGLKANLRGPRADPFWE